MGFGVLTITGARAEAVDFSLPYFEEVIGLFSIKEGELAKWRALFWPFELRVWVLILLAPLLFGLAWWILARGSDPDAKESNSALYYIKSSLKILLMQREVKVI